MAKTYNTISTFTSGQVLTAAQMNEIGTNSNNFRVPPMCRVVRNATQSIANSTETFVTWPTLVTDTEAPGDPIYAAGSSDRLTIRTEGLYVVTASVLVANNATGIRTMAILRNPTAANNYAAAIAGNWVPPMSEDIVVNASTVIALSVADNLRVSIFQNSGGALNVGSTARALTQFSVCWVGQAS
jgi:hypothetical protein